MKTSPRRLLLLLASLAATADALAQRSIVDFPSCQKLADAGVELQRTTFSSYRLKVGPEGQIQVVEPILSTGTPEVDKVVAQLLATCRAKPGLATAAAETNDESVATGFHSNKEFRLSSGLTPWLNAVACWNLKDDYPKASMLDNEQGVAVVAFSWNEKGEIINAEIEKSSKFRRLDKASLASIKRCAITPGRAPDGRPLPGSSRFSYQWSLQ